MNRLASETSPYLLQHKDNPVHWNPWDAQALQRAKDEDKPIFLSIGYSACHWCHVMEHESFENDGVAAVLNELFVPIKVDREERPDLDDVYMKATQVLSGHGGWPMSVFLTPDLEPFYAGTYFPLIPRHGMPSFPHVLEQLSRAWKSSRDQVEDQARKVVERVQQLSFSAEHLQAPLVVERPHLDLMDGALQQLGQLFDPGHGGFGGPPKFPHADDIRLCLWQHASTSDAHALHMAEHTLDNMMRGGIYDQLGGGFARYSVDGEWTVPHFEKMLYDNALLVPAFLEAHALTGRDDFALVARECCEWVLREMIDPEGGIWSTQDADSEGEEGRFYVWQRDTVLEIVGREHAKLVDVAWGLSESENFEGHAWILRRNKLDTELAEELGLADPAALRAALEPLRAKLFEARDKRVHPGTDDKVLASWNGLMIGALARTGSQLGEPRFVQAAERAAAFCLETLRPDGRRLLATWRAGKAHIMATLADYAYLAAGLLDLFEATGETRWALEAEQLVSVAREHFADPSHGGFFMTADDAEQLVARPRDLFDGALPSSNGVMAEVLVRLAALTGDQDLASEADRLFALAAPLVQGSPSAFARLLLALARVHAGSRTVVVTEGDGHAELLAAARSHGDPSLAVVSVPADGVPAAAAERLGGLAGRVAVDGKATAYVCRIGACGAPATSVDALRAQLG